MRWPIQRQVLLPMLLVVVLTSVLASGVSAWVGGHWARRAEQDRLARVVATLADANFPLQETVLQKLSGLSGADFVVWDDQQRVQAATISLHEELRERLRDVPAKAAVADLASNPRIVIGDREFSTARVPLRRSQAVPLDLLVLYPADRLWTSTRGAVLPPLLAGGATAILAIAWTAWWSRLFVKPIARLNQQSEAIAGGTFQPMPLPPRDDELRDLTHSINRMVEQLTRYEQQVRRSERLKTLGQLGAGLAHQLRNWLTGTRLALQLHARECPLGEQAESTETALRQIGLMESYLQRFLTLGATSVGADHDAMRREFSLTEMIGAVLSLVRPRCQHAGITIQWSPPDDPLMLVADHDELQQLLVNLLLNGIEAAAGRDVSSASESAWVRIESERRPDSKLCVRVLDSGPGPSAAISEQLFEAFVTDKPEGTGLGLAVARRIAEAHGGALCWRREGGATCFELVLPA